MAIDTAFDADVVTAQAVYSQLGAWIDRYHGGMPAGFLAAAVAHESGGNFNAPGDPTLGEVGFLQIAAYVPPLFGYDPSARTDPETNIALGALEYAMEGVYWHMAYPDAVMLGTDDDWKLARLAFAVGRAGSHQLAQAAQAGGGLTTGDVYHDITRWVQRTGGMPLGSQGASKVAQRVLDIDRQWAIGQAVASGTSGPPMLIPDPPAGPYTLPLDVAPYFVRPLSGTVLLALGSVALLYLLLTQE